MAFETYRAEVVVDANFRIRIGKSSRGCVHITSTHPSYPSPEVIELIDDEAMLSPGFRDELYFGFGEAEQQEMFNNIVEMAEEWPVFRVQLVGGARRRLPHLVEMLEHVFEVNG